MAKVKTVNYTPKQTAEMVAAYVHAETADQRGAVVQKFADTLGKTTRSIVAKLSREGVYVKKEYATKTGGKAVTKNKLVTEIAAAMECDEEQLNGMENATKKALQTILTFVKSKNEE